MAMRQKVGQWDKIDAAVVLILNKFCTAASSFYIFWPNSRPPGNINIVLAGVWWEGGGGPAPARPPRYRFIDFRSSAARYIPLGKFRKINFRSMCDVYYRLSVHIIQLYCILIFVLQLYKYILKDLHVSHVRSMHCIRWLIFRFLLLEKCTSENGFFLRRKVG